MSRKFPVVEIFGPTIQGEGALAGVPSHFVRFGGCDFRCVWCDSPHAVIPELVKINSKLMTATEIGNAVIALEGMPHWVTLSGGNPALLELGELLNLLQAVGFKVAIETQGTMVKPWMQGLDMVTVSPKGPSSGNVVTPDMLRKFLDALNSEHVVLKVVVFDDDDYSYAQQIHGRFPRLPFYLSVGTYSGGLDGQWKLEDGKGYDSAESLSARYRWLSEKVALDTTMRDVTVFPQLHYLMWGSEKGR